MTHAADAMYSERGGHAQVVLWTTTSAAAFTALRFASPWSNHLALFLLAHAIAWIACVGVARTRVTLPVLLGGALLWRLLLVLLPPTLSDDIFRYVWEGQIQARGWNPYVHAPASEALRALRNDIWPHINHPTASAIYPPWTQLVFRCLATFAGVTGFKIVFCLVDLILVWVLALGLRRRNRPLGPVAWYAWNPLVIVEVAGSGHFEPLALLPLACALLWIRNRPTVAWLALAGSIATKYAAALLVVPLARARRPTAWAVLGTIVLLGAITWPYRDAGMALFDSLRLYATTWRYNDLVFGLIETVCRTPDATRIASGVLLLGVVVGMTRLRAGLETRSMGILLSLVLLSPTIHPWYLLWPAALLPWARSRTLLAWTLTVPLAYAFLVPLGSIGVVDTGAGWIRAVQWLSLVLGLAADVRATRATHRPPSPAQDRALQNDRIALVMPALDEEESLPAVFEDLARLAAPHLDDVVVVDNGSADRTAAIARAAGATVLDEPRRGYGAACLRALRALEERPPGIVVFMDADRSDDAAQIIDLVQPLRDEGVDLVIGSRTRGQAEAGALLPQARFGNWLATRLIRWTSGFQYTDLGPFRAVRWEALQRLRMADRDFGWTVEMQMRAVQENLSIREVPVRYRRRVGRSKISGTVGGSVRAGVKILATWWRLRGAT